MKLWLSLIVVLCCTADAVEAAARKAYASQGVLVEGCSTTVCCVSERGFHQCPHNGGTCCSNSGYCCPSGFRCTSTFGQPSCTQIPAMKCNAAIGCTLKDWIRPRMVGSESSHSEHSFHSEHPMHSEHSMHSHSHSHSHSKHSEHSMHSHSHSESSRAVESSAPAPSHPPAPLFPPPNLELESGGHQPGQAEVSKQDAADSLQGVAAIASALPVGVTITTTKNIGGKVYTTTITRNSANGKSIIGGESSEGSAHPPSSSSMPPSESSAPPHSGVLAPSESSAPAGNCETSACRKGKLKINSNVEVSLTKKHLK